MCDHGANVFWCECYGVSFPRLERETDSACCGACQYGCSRRIIDLDPGCLETRCCAFDAVHLFTDPVPLPKARTMILNLLHAVKMVSMFAIALQGRVQITLRSQYPLCKEPIPRPPRFNKILDADRRNPYKTLELTAGFSGRRHPLQPPKVHTTLHHCEPLQYHG
jgi:hypothetical protein